MRDLTAEHRRTPNGDGPTALDLDVPEAPDETTVRQERSTRRTVNRDKGLAEMALLMMETAKMIEPVVTLIGARVLRWATLGVASGLMFYAILHPSWERAAIAAGFMLLSPLLWWRA